MQSVKKKLKDYEFNLRLQMTKKKYTARACGYVQYVMAYHIQ